MTDFPSLDYSFFSPERIRLGWGSRREVGTLARPFGERAYIICGSRTLAANGLLDELKQNLVAAGIEAVPLATIEREPEVVDVDAAVETLRPIVRGSGDLVIAIGGGSAIDLAKAVSALATNREGETVADYLEGVGKGLKIVNPPLPVLAMPTTAGTGSEATKNAVISNYSPLFKKSLRSDLMVPRAVLIDPELTVGLSKETTAHTGMDAITQLVESFISKRAKPIPRALCLQGLEMALPSLAEACENPTSRSAREKMAHAALLSGIALANSGLGMAHGVAAALGVHCGVPHGLACAVVLPATLRANREVSREDLATLSCLVPADAPFAFDPTTIDGSADAFIRFIEALGRQIGIPSRLSEMGVRADHIPALVKASRGNSMDGNPREISDGELTAILTGML
ncbi:MAG: iron-containing alcohol dehydrogenase [Planctomycetaceae bacterium]